MWDTGRFDRPPLDDLGREKKSKDSEVEVFFLLCLGRTQLQNTESAKAVIFFQQNVFLQSSFSG